MGTWRRGLLILFGLAGMVAAAAAVARRNRAAEPDLPLNGSSPHRGSAQHWPPVPRAPGGVPPARPILTTTRGAFPPGRWPGPTAIPYPVSGAVSATGWPRPE